MSENYYDMQKEENFAIKKSSFDNSISISRVLERLDGLLMRNDYLSAEAHLIYWLKEATAQNDISAQFAFANELIGIYRKTLQEKKTADICKFVLLLCENERIKGTVSEGTALINIATAYKAFNKTESALPLYKRAKEIYEGTLDKNDSRLAGLYNNMAISLTELKNFSEAKTLFNNALNILEGVPNSEGERAITYLNIADLYVAEKGYENTEKEIAALIETAMELLNSISHQSDGNYAFICEKCAPVFAYYGYFLYEQQLKERAKRIYEGN